MCIEFDIVAFEKDLPSEGVKKNDTGILIEVHDSPRRWYIVEVEKTYPTNEVLVVFCERGDIRTVISDENIKKSNNI